jgi:hypothetical protein
MILIKNEDFTNTAEVVIFDLKAQYQDFEKFLKGLFTEAKPK